VNIEKLGLRVFQCKMFCGSAVQVADRCGGLSSHVHKLSGTTATIVAIVNYDFRNYLWCKIRVY
jgi:hypothetical protein